MSKTKEPATVESIAAAVNEMVKTPKPIEVPRKAFTIERAPGGWSFVTCEYNDSGEFFTTKTTPDLKAMAINEFKKAAFHYWSEID